MPRDQTPYGSMEPTPFSFDRDRGTLEAPTRTAPKPLADLSVAELKALAVFGDTSARNELYDRAEAGDSVSRRVIAELAKPAAAAGDPRPADMPEQLTYGATPIDLFELRKILDRWGAGYRLEPDVDDPHNWVVTWPVQGWGLRIVVA